MNTRGGLSRDERGFFETVNQAVLSNPFSDERSAIDRRLAQLAPDAPEADVLDAAIAAVRRRIDHLDATGRGTLQTLDPRDHTIATNAFLFDFFHRFAETFDTLIRDQIAAGTDPIAVPFAAEAIGDLCRRGIPDEAARRYFALSFQFRRAYYFIKTGLVGRCPCMRTLRRSLWNNVFTANLNLYNEHLWNRLEDFSTMVLGGTGSGKGTVAMSIGRSGFIPFDSQRGRFVESFTQSFVAINLSEFSEALIESELFGHQKGAFTGAIENHQGVFSRCSPHGAIFLDEIGEVSAPLQIKLLKVLEERLFRPVGSHREERFHGRIIAATNRGLEEIEQGRVFRDDFFFRLCSDMIWVPPLRQRLEEDPAELDDLLAHTVERTVGHPSPDLAEMVGGVIRRELGERYPWPGNVRELGQCVRRILLTGSCRTVKPAAADAEPSSLAREMDRGSLSAQRLLEGYCHLLYQRLGTFGEVARRTALDRRTVKKYVLAREEAVKGDS